MATVNEQRVVYLRSTTKVSVLVRRDTCGKGNGFWFLDMYTRIVSDRDFVFHLYETDRGKGYLNGLVGQVCQRYGIKSIQTANLTSKCPLR